MEKQQTFDTVVAHLRKQGCKAISKHGTCMYRAQSGAMCAAGCLIPDDKYISEMEGQSVIQGGGKRLARKCVIELGHNIDLVQSLQNVHDQSEVRDWERMLQATASAFWLAYTPPTI